MCATFNYPEYMCSTSTKQRRFFGFKKLSEVLTRQDMHEDGGEFVDEQHGRTVCYGQ